MLRLADQASSGARPSAQTLGAGAGGVLSKSASSPSSRLAHTVSASLLPSFTACASGMLKLLLLCFAAHAIHRGWRGPEFRPLTSGASAPLCSRPGAPGSAVLRGFNITFGVCAAGAHAIRPQVYAARGWTHVPSLTATPNPSLVGTATGKHFAREGALVLSSASRTKRSSASAPQLKRWAGCNARVLASAVMAAVAAKCQMPNARLPRRHGGSRQQRACRSGLAVKALAALAQSQGASRGRKCLHSASRWRPLQRRLFSPRLQLVLTGSALNSQVVGLAGFAQARARLQATASSALVAVAPPSGPQRSLLKSHRLLRRQPWLPPKLLLTLRSWGLPPARHLAHGRSLSSSASRSRRLFRRQPLSSNVGPHGPAQPREAGGR